MDLSEFQFARLDSARVILPFDCGDNDLNEYLFEDAKRHLEELLFVTYLLEKDGKTAAFFSVANDVVATEIAKSKILKRIKFRFHLKDQKYATYPAVKVGRFAVHSDYQRSGLGTVLLDYIKQTFISNNRTGCVLITVDAFVKSLDFYTKNGFEFLCQERE